LKDITGEHESMTRIFNLISFCFLILILALVAFYGCAPKPFPYEVEDWVERNLPYEKGFFDCRHRATIAVEILS
jgi:hypothetical protein